MKAELEVCGVTYSVVSTSLSFGQGTNAQGNATSEIYGGQFMVTLASISSEENATDPNKKKLIEWMRKPDKKEDGKISFYILSEESVDRTVEFKKALCTSLTESWGSNGLTMMLGITPNVAVVEGIDFPNPQSKS